MWRRWEFPEKVPRASSVRKLDKHESPLRAQRRSSSSDGEHIRTVVECLKWLCLHNEAIIPTVVTVSILHLLSSISADDREIKAIFFLHIPPILSAQLSDPTPFPTISASHRISLMFPLLTSLNETQSPPCRLFMVLSPNKTKMRDFVHNFPKSHIHYRPMIINQLKLAQRIGLLKNV